MAWTFRTETTNTGASGTTPQVTKNTGLANNDIIYLALAVNGSATPPSAPSGFSQIASETTQANPKIYLYRKVITDASGEPATWSFGGTIAGAWGLRANGGAGGDTTTPEDVTPVTNSSAAATSLSTNITPVTAGTMLWSWVAINSSTSAIDDQTGAWTNGAEIGERKNQSAWREEAGTSQQTVTWTFPNRACAMITTAFRPSAGDVTGTVNNGALSVSGQTVTATYDTTGTINTGTLTISGQTVTGTEVQIARPISDVSAGNWTPSSGIDLYAMLDEDPASESDYIQSGFSPSSADICEVQLTSLTDPASSSDHVVSYRYYNDAPGSDQLDLTVSLRQGTSTEIAAWTHNNIGGTVVQADQTLSGAQADAITDYSDLRIRFSAVKP